MNPSALPYGVAAWGKNDEWILVYDRYDIWKLDPAGVDLPVNITNFYGRQNKTMLRVVKLNPYGVMPVEIDGSLILCALDETNKENGFFRKQLHIKGDPIKLIMQSAVYYFPNINSMHFSSFLLKANEANTCLLKRMSAVDYPNLVLTKDFKSFVSLTNLMPQKNYNWLTSELVRWTTFDRRPGEGILYKPENFDPHKKYPIIFYCYEQLANTLNVFHRPELSDGILNIPSYVSNGYLVFCPDIHYATGLTGYSAYNYIVSAAKMMSLKPYVDPKRMGLQGHSMGGYEVNYVITQSSLFSAAVSAAGMTDFVSLAGIPLPIEGVRDPFTRIEGAQSRMGVSFWHDLDRYLKKFADFLCTKDYNPIINYA